MVNVPTAVWIDESGMIVRPNEVAYALDTFRAITGVDSARYLGVPLTLTLGGGYSEPIDATLEAHVNTYRAARECYGKTV